MLNAQRYCTHVNQGPSGPIALRACPIPTELTQVYCCILASGMGHFTYLRQLLVTLSKMRCVCGDFGGRQFQDKSTAYFFYQF